MESTFQAKEYSSRTGNDSLNHLQGGKGAHNKRCYWLALSAHKNAITCTRLIPCWWGRSTPRLRGSSVGRWWWQSSWHGRCYLVSVPHQINSNDSNLFYKNVGVKGWGLGRGGGGGGNSHTTTGAGAFEGGIVFR